MSLPSNHLDAFSAVARHKSFSLAAQKLHITQSALSQRILNLEEELGHTLFIREPAGVRLTELGQRLLLYCQSREALEAEFLGNVKSKNTKELSGIIRIGSFSTLTNSILLPLLAKIVKTHPKLKIEIHEAELRDLPGLLTSGRVDFIFLNEAFQKQAVENLELGVEENVLIQAAGKSEIPDVYIDNDEEDLTTYNFFKFQGWRNISLERNYLHNIHSILEAVRLGLGKAVVPMHMIPSKGFEIIPKMKTQKVPVYLAYYAMAYYTDLQKLLIDQFTEEIPKLLKA